MSRKYLILSRDSPRQKHCPCEETSGEGLLVTQLLLYLPTYFKLELQRSVLKVIKLNKEKLKMTKCLV
jgi:hypothetical protein